MLFEEKKTKYEHFSLIEQNSLFQNQDILPYLL